MNVLPAFVFDLLHNHSAVARIAIADDRKNEGKYHEYETTSLASGVDNVLCTCPELLRTGFTTRD